MVSKIMRVGIVGAGPSGLTAIKTCLDYGLQPVCFEATYGIGGLWNYTEYLTEGKGTVMKSTVINTSKEMTAYSDYPPDENLPNFMHHSKLMGYLRDYANHFNLTEFIQFEHEVTLIEKAEDHEQSGKWMLNVLNKQTMQVATETVDAVFLCTGHHGTPHRPDFKGLNSVYEGQVIHSHSYRTDKGFEEKNVLVVGIGNSATDISAELSRHASKVFLSTRQGAWMFSKTMHGGYPYDIVLFSRFCSLVQRYMPTVASKYLEFCLNSRFNHRVYGLRPNWGVFQAHPTLSDDLPSRINTGFVSIKANVREFTKHGAIFEDESEENIDVVVLCTGYEMSFPFLKPDILKMNNNDIALYQNMYVTHLSHPQTLVFIGFIQPLGSIMPISEMQCRVACQVLVGDTVLPDAQEMSLCVQEKRKEIRKRYVKSQRHTIQVDYIPYMDELASMIGAKPNPLRYLFTDPKLTFQMISGPCVPYQYRLTGPHSWPKARDTLMHTWDRVRQPLTSRKVELKQEGILYYAQNIPSIIVLLLLLSVVSPLWVFFLAAL